MSSIRQEKAVELARQFGFDSVDNLLEEAAFESVVPGICMNVDCDYSTDVEPDCRDGYCDCCGTNTVKSVLEFMMF
jgi:hypothetical protein